MNDTNDRQRRLAVYVAANTTDIERQALIAWVGEMLELRSKAISTPRKIKLAYELTTKRDVVLPAARLIGREVKRHAWDDRTLKGRMGLGAAAVAAALFGGQGAGIAALGGAVAVPLWIVIGAGGTFAGMLIEELAHKRGPKG